MIIKVILSSHSLVKVIIIVIIVTLSYLVVTLSSCFCRAKGGGEGGCEGGRADERQDDGRDVERAGSDCAGDQEEHCQH